MNNIIALIETLHDEGRSGHLQLFLASDHLWTARLVKDDLCNEIIEDPRGDRTKLFARAESPEEALSDLDAKCRL